MAVFVTLTNGYLLRSFSNKTTKPFSPTLPEPLKIDFFNIPEKPCPCMPHVGRQHLERPHHGKPKLTLKSKTQKEARMMYSRRVLQKDINNYIKSTQGAIKYADIESIGRKHGFFTT